MTLSTWYYFGIAYATSCWNFYPEEQNCNQLFVSETFEGNNFI